MDSTARKVIVGLIVASAWLTARPGAAQPFAMSYTGHFMTPDGKALSGPLDIEVRFFRDETGGSQIGSAQLFREVKLSDGVFTLDFALSLTEYRTLFNQLEDVWVEIKNVNDNLIMPRQQYRAVPYALGVPVDGKTLSFGADGRLTVMPLTAPGANQFLTKDGSGNFVWATPDGVSMSGATGVGSVALAPQKTFGLGNYTTAEESGLLTGLTAADKGKTWFNADSGAMRLWNGSAAVSLGVSGGGISSLGESGQPQTGSAQVLAIGTAGTAPDWVSSSDTHTLNIPSAATGGVTAGTISNAQYTLFDAKLDASALNNLNADKLTSGTVANARIGWGAPGNIGGTTPATGTFTAVTTNNLGLSLQDNDGTANYAVLKAANNMAANQTYTLPAAADAGKYLSTDASGNLSWTTPVSSGDMLKATYDVNTDSMIDVAKGGTGAANATDARNNLGLGALATAAAVSGGAAGTITDDTIVNADIKSDAAIATTKLSGAVTSITGHGLGTAATLNVGTGNNNVVQLDGAAKMPAVDGSALTNLNASNLATGTIDNARITWGAPSAIGGTTPAAGTFTTLNATSVTSTSVTSTSVTTGNTGVSLQDNDGGAHYAVLKAATNMAATQTYTLPAAADAGKYLSTDASGNLSWTTPSGAGDMLKATYDVNTDSMIDLARGGTGAANATDARTNLGLGALATAAAVSGGAAGTITDDTIVNADIKSDAAIATTKLSGAVTSITGHGLGTAATLNVGTGNNNIVQLDGAAKLPAVDGSALTNLNASNLASGTIDNARITWGAPSAIGGTTPAAGTFTTLNASSVTTENSGIKLQDNDGGAHYAVLKAASTMAASQTYTLPAAADAGKYLSTDASGNLSWTTPSGAGDMAKATYDVDTNGIIDLDKGGTGAATAAAARANLGLAALATAAAVSGGAAGTITDDTIVNADINSGAAIATSKLSGAVTSITGHGLGTAATLNVGTGSNNIVQLDGTAKLPVVDGSALTNLNASNLASGTISNVRIKWDAPSAIGGTTAAAGTFTTLNAGTLITGDAGVVLKDNDGTSHFATIKAASAMAASQTYTLPAAADAGKFLSTDAAGVLSWSVPGGGGTVTNITAGTGLNGGSITGSGTIDLANTAVTAGSYTRANITVDQQGRITAAANGSAVALATDVTGTLAVGSGGSGATSFTNNGVLLGSGALPLSATSAGAADTVLRVPGAGGAPAFGAIDLTKSAAVTGILPLANGGVGANLSATGGANQFLKQTSAGGAVTVAAIAAADLPAMVGDSGSGGTKGAVPAPGTGDAAANKYLKADGTWAAPSATVSGGTGGTITDDTITNADIKSAAAIATSKLSGAVTSITGHGLGTAAILNVGTGASNIVQLDGSGWLPNLNGSGLSNLNASNLSSGTVPNGRIGWDAPGSIGSSTPATGTFTAVTTNNLGLSLQDNDGGPHYAVLKAATNMTSNQTYTLPASADAGKFLSTDASGNLSWMPITASPGGSSTEVQFNNGGSLGGDSNFAWDNTKRVLKVAGPGTGNMFIGDGAGNSSTSGNNNIFTGYRSGYYNTEGTNNVFSGFQAGYNNTTGSNNVFSGREAGFANTTGLGNAFGGHQAGYNNVTGSNNTFYGNLAAYDNTSGSNNIAIGTNAGRSNTTGNHNTFIGMDAGHTGTSPNLSNATAIGYNAQVTANNSLILGNNANVGIGTTAPAHKLSVAGTLGIIESGGSPTNYTVFRGGVQSTDITYTLPTAAPAASGQVLSSDTSGVMSWVGASTGTVTSIATGTGLTGGPISTSGTIALDDTAVSPGTYTRANITVDQQGRITAAATSSAVDLGSGEVSGTLPVANGGTGATTLTTNGVLLGAGAGAVTATAAGPNYSVLRVPLGGGAPAFGAINLAVSAAVMGWLGRANGGTGTDLSITGGANQFLKQVSYNGAITVATITAADLPAMVGDSGTGGTKGAVPAPAAGDAAKLLKGDGTWGYGTIPNFAVGSHPDCTLATNQGLMFRSGSSVYTCTNLAKVLISRSKPHVAFVTSALYNGLAVGGVSGADAKCQLAGDSFDSTETYKAILGVPTLGSGISERIKVVSSVYNRNPVPALVATHEGNFWGAHSSADGQIDYDQSGTSQTGSAWTGAANQDGFRGTALHCSNWTAPTGTGNVGTVGSAAQWLSTGSTTACSVTLRLYCITQ